MEALPAITTSPEYKKATTEHNQQKAEVKAETQTQVSDLRSKFSSRKLTKSTETTNSSEVIKTTTEKQEVISDKKETITQKNKELVSCVDGVCDSGLTSKNISE